MKPVKWPWKRPPLDRSALEEARKHLAETRAREVRVAAVVEETKRQLRENHFAPTIAKALGGHR